MRTLAFALFAASFTAVASSAQITLHQQLGELAREARGKVYVACSLPGTKLDCNLQPHGHPPMQSTFKFPLAMAVLHKVDLGQLKLDQPVRFAASDRMPGSHSPMQDKYPAANVDVPLGDMLRYSVGESDNVATDILVRMAGGPAAVTAHLRSLHIDEIHVLNDEHGLSQDENRQYANYAEPAAMVQLLCLLADHSPLSPKSTDFLNDIMEHGSTGASRIKALLPAGTVLAHKTGTSGVDKSGLNAATNDVGLITLPSGKRLAIAIFITDSHAPAAAAEHVIAAIAKAVYDAAGEQ